MKSSRGRFHLIVFAGGALSVTVIALSLLVFRSPDASPARILSETLLSGLAFLAIQSLCLLPVGKRYAFGFSAEGLEQAAYARALAALGKAPLTSLALCIVTTLAYIVAFFALGDGIGIQGSAHTSLFLYVLSLSMLNAAFVYVLSDKLATETLLAHRLERYPLSLRENRQRSKIFIIPVFMTIMALCFAYSTSDLVSSHLAAGGSFPVSEGLVTVVVTAIFFAIVLALVLIWNATTAQVYRSLIAQMESLSSGEKDLSRRVHVSSVDELGTIAGMVNLFSDDLARAVADIKAEEEKLSGMGSSLEANAETSAAAVLQISESVDRVRQKTQSQSAGVVESSSAVQQIARNIEGLDALIIDQSAGITESSASIEEMMGSIQSINATVDRLADAFGELAAAAEEGNATQAESGQRIVGIVERSEALQEANSVIAAIATQTNLLAMNAAIEAAHAGEAGKGFSVVADEIRRLAETSSEQSRAINAELGQVRDEMGGVVAASRASEDAFRGVADRIGAMNSLVREIQAAMDEQRSGARLILEALKSMNDITSQVRSGSSEMSMGASTVIEEMRRLQESAMDISRNMDDMASGATELTTGADAVSGMAETTHASIRRLESVVSAFKLGR